MKIICFNPWGRHRGRHWLVREEHEPMSAGHAYPGVLARGVTLSNNPVIGWVAQAESAEPLSPLARRTGNVLRHDERDAYCWHWVVWPFIWRRVTQCHQLTLHADRSMRFVP
ncbi:MAG: hypothetical protein WC030_00550 [Candidatus Paceibacterota bacterium]